MIYRRKMVKSSVGLIAIASGCLSGNTGNRLTESSSPFNIELDLEDSTYGGNMLPDKYTQQGKGISPPVRFSNTPTEANTICLTMRDVGGEEETPLWLIWNIPSTIDAIPEGVPNTSPVNSLSGAVQGENQRGSIGYSGPDTTKEYANPDGGKTSHSVEITAYAVNGTIDSDKSLSHSKLMSYISEHDRVETSINLKF